MKFLKKFTNVKQNIIEKQITKQTAYMLLIEICLQDDEF